MAAQSGDVDGNHGRLVEAANCGRLAGGDSYGKRLEGDSWRRKSEETCHATVMRSGDSGVG